MHNESPILGIGYVVLSSFVYALAPSFARFASDEGSNAVGTLIARFTIAALIMLAIRATFLRETPWPARRTTIELLLFGGIGYFLGALFYFTALETIDSSLAIVLFNCYPLFIVVLSWLMFKQRPSKAVLATLTLTLSGVTIAAGEIGSGNLRSIFLCIGSALLYTAYALGSSRSITRTDVITGTALVMVGGATSFWLYWLVGGGRVSVSFPNSVTGWSMIVLMGTVSTIGGTMLFFSGLRLIGPSKSSVATTSEPVFAIALGALLLNEGLTVARVVGAIFVISALLIFAVRESLTERVTW